MSEEYFKEIDITNWRGIAITIIAILLVLALLIIPHYTAIDTYSSTTYERQTLSTISVNNTTTKTYGSFYLTNKNILTKTTPNSNGYAIINDNNKTLLKQNETLTLHFVNLVAGSNSLTLQFYNSTYDTEIATFTIDIQDQATIGVVEVDINDISIGTHTINIYNFRINPMINITQLNNEWIIQIGKATFNITKETLDYTDGIPYIPTNKLVVSGAFFTYYGLENLTISKVKVNHSTLPFIKDQYALYGLIIVGIVTATIVYFKPEHYLETILAGLLLLIILTNYAFNLTEDMAYLISTTMIFIILTLTVMIVNFSNIETADEILEKHMWKLTLVWIVLLAIYIYMRFF